MEESESAPELEEYDITDPTPQNPTPMWSASAQSQAPYQNQTAPRNTGLEAESLSPWLADTMRAGTLHRTRPDGTSATDSDGSLGRSATGAPRRAPHPSGPNLLCPLPEGSPRHSARRGLSLTAPRAAGRGESLGRVALGSVPPTFSAISALAAAHALPKSPRLHTPS